MGAGVGVGPGLVTPRIGVGVGVIATGVGAGVEPSTTGVGVSVEPSTAGGGWMTVILPANGAGRTARLTLVGAGATGFKVTPVRRITATAFPPAVPLSSPSISWPEVSCKPEGDVPLIVSSTGLVRANAFLGVSVTVSFAGLNTAERSFDHGRVPGRE